MNLNFPAVHDEQIGDATEPFDEFDAEKPALQRHFVLALLGVEWSLQFRHISDPAASLYLPAQIRMPVCAHTHTRTERPYIQARERELEGKLDGFQNHPFGLANMMN